MKIINLTPHTVNLYAAKDVEVSQQGAHSLKASAQPVHSFPSMGVAYAKKTFSLKFAGFDDFGGTQWKCEHGLGAPIGLPESLSCDEFVLVTRDVYDAAVAHGYAFINQLWYPDK